MNSQNVEHVGIAHRHIKERRARKIVPVAPGGTLADYVPFYFAPRSPMLYAIYTGSVEGYTEDQIEVLHLVTSVETIQKEKLPFVFTDGHAEIAFSRFYDNVSALDQIDWDIMKAIYWNDTEQDNDRKRRRQAEFLVYQFFPWELVEEIGVINNTVAERVKGISSFLGKFPEVMEGHFIRGYGDRSRYASIRLLPGATDEANSFLQGHKETIERLDRVARLIEGFESPYGMELLSTVHWVAQEDPEVKNDSRVAIKGFKAWSEHKKQTFHPEHIEVAWIRLREEGWI